MRTGLASAFLATAMLWTGLAAEPRYLERLRVGGGYGDGGTDIEQNGDVSMNGSLVVDGTITAGSGREAITNSFGKLRLPALEQGGASTGQALQWNGDEWSAEDLPIGMSGFTLTGMEGAGNTPQAVGDGETLRILGTGGISTVAVEPDTIQIGLPTGVSGQVLKFLGSQWMAGSDENTTYTAGNGLKLSGAQFSLADGASAGQVWKWTGSAWGLAADETGSSGMSGFMASGQAGTPQSIGDGDTLTIAGGGGLSTAASGTDTVTVNLPSGTSGQVLKHNGTLWAAGNDENTTYTAGNGLKLSGAQFGLGDGTAAGQVWKWTGSAWGLASDETGSGMSGFTVSGQTGTPQSIGDGDTLTITGSGGLSTAASGTDTVTVSLPSGTSGQVLKHNGTAWAAGTDNTGTASTHYGMLWLSVTDMFHDRTTGQGPTLNSRTNGTAAYFEHDYYTFDKDTDRDLYASFAVGPDVSGSTVTVSLFTAATNTAGEQKDARWGLSIRALSDDTWPDVLYGFGSTHDTLTYGYYGPNKTRGLEIVSTNVTVTGLSSGKWCVMRITRLGSDAGDDLDAGADLMGVRVYYPKS